MLGWEGGKKKKEKLIKLNTKQTEKRSPFDFRPRNNPHSANFHYPPPPVLFYTPHRYPLIPLDTVFISIFISMAWYGTWHGMAHTFCHSPPPPFSPSPSCTFAPFLVILFSYFSLGFSSLIFAYVFSFESRPPDPLHVPLFCFLRTFAFCVSFVADDDASCVCVCK